MSKPKKVEHKLLLQISSILIAIIMWFIIVYTENPTQDVTMNDIKIQYVGESGLQDAGLILLDKINLPGGAITVRGSRSDLMRALKETTASVDLTHITSAGQYNLPVEYSLPSSDLDIIKRKIPSISITVADMETKDVPVKIIQIGGEKNKDRIVESVPEKETMTIRGAKEDLDRINCAIVSVDITTVLPDAEQKYSYILADDTQNAVQTDNEILTEDEVISVVNHVHTRKTLPVEVTFPTSLTEKFSIHIQSLSQESIDVGILEGAQAPETLTVEFTDSVEEGKDTYQITLTAPEGIYIPKENLSLEMKAEVKKKTIDSFDVTVQAKDADGIQYEISPQTVSVRARGPKDKLIAENVSATVSLEGLSQGEHWVAVKLKSKDMDVDVLNDAHVIVRIH